MVFTQQRTGAGERAVGGEQPTEIVLYGGYKVRHGREKWADELFATCVRLGMPPDRQGRAHLRELSTRVGLRGANSLIAALAGPDYPKIATLRKLEQDAGLSVLRSLLALEVLDVQDVLGELAALGLHPQEMSPALRDLLTHARPWSDPVLASVARLLRQAAREDARGSSRAASPTDEDR